MARHILFATKGGLDQEKNFGKMFNVHTTTRYLRPKCNSFTEPPIHTSLISSSEP